MVKAKESGDTVAHAFHSGEYDKHLKARFEYSRKADEVFPTSPEGIESAKKEAESKALIERTHAEEADRAARAEENRKADEANRKAEHEEAKQAKELSKPDDEKTADYHKQQAAHHRSEAKIRAREAKDAADYGQTAHSAELAQIAKKHLELVAHHTAAYKAALAGEQGKTPEPAPAPEPPKLKAKVNSKAVNDLIALHEHSDAAQAVVDKVTPGMTYKDAYKTLSDHGNAMWSDPNADPKARTLAFRLRDALHGEEASVPVDRTQGPKNLDEATADKSLPVERDWHKLTFGDADPRTLAAIKNTPSLTGVTYSGTPDQGAHYNHKHHIQMNAESPDKATDWAKGTWRHEMGHAIDYAGTGADVARSFQTDTSRKSEASALVKRVSGKANPPKGYPDDQFEQDDWIAKHGDSAMAKDGISQADVSDFIGEQHAETSQQRGRSQQIKENLDKLLSGAPITQPELLSIVRQENEGPHEVKRYDHEARKVVTVTVSGDLSSSRRDQGMLHDFMGALTSEKVGYGHGKAYYKKRESLNTAEMFAQYVALTSGKSANIYRAIMHNLAPASCKVFDGILDETAYPKRIA
jgi:hypothetical protein